MIRAAAFGELPPHALLLLAIRRQRQWTQAELARELCVSERTVRRWEAGHSEPPGVVVSLARSLLAALAKAL